jgi:UDP-N-acetylmuramate--alanine ligase
MSEGITVIHGHDAYNVSDDVDLIVYTIAVPESNPELQFAKERSIPCKTYPEALGEITKEKVTIAVSGTHGKTTTTAMMYYAMKACGVNPTLIVGSLLSDKGTNFVLGDSKYMVVEACEYKRSFLNLHPTHAVVTNIDEDHLDYYKDINDITTAFESFAERLPASGMLVTHPDVKLSTLARTITTASVDLSSIELSVLGEHNRHNAALVIALLTALGFDEMLVRKGLRDFPGTWRRLEYKGKTLHGVPVYDDYGHHPSEIEASYAALREKFPKDEFHIIMLFQPHLYSRTKALLNEFVSVLKTVDEVYVLPIYKARLEDTTVIDEERVVDAICQSGGNAKRLHSLSDIPAFVESVTSPSTVIINMGAGNAFEQLDTLTLL